MKNNQTPHTFMDGTLETGLASHSKKGSARTMSLTTELLETTYPLTVGLQPVGLVDHVAKVDWPLQDAVPESGGDRCMSQQMSLITSSKKWKVTFPQALPLLD